MKKDFFKKIMSGVLAAVAALSMSACGGGGTAGGGNKPVDTNKTQINVRYFDSGYGSEWLSAIAEEYEKKNANKSFEEGKTGVQVHFEGDKNAYTSTTVMATEKYDIYFLENDSYFALVNSGDGLEDLTSTVTETNPYDSKKVEDKLTEQQKNFFGIKDSAGETHYYALPHYYGNIGLVYDVDLFNEKNFYFADDKTNGDFIASKTQKKSAGPDGEYNTDDDGLPATYAEFFTLMDEMIANNIVPMTWAGNENIMNGYMCGFLDALIADYEGLSNMMMNFTFEGTEDLVKLDESGAPMFKTDGTLDLEEVTVTKNTGYEVARQPGKYYAFEFIEKLLRNDKYSTGNSWKESTQTDAQQTFLESVNKNERVAMLLDGPWWQREATMVFESMARKNANWAMNKRNLGWMPLPKATSDKVGSANTYCDVINATVCLKKGAGTRKDACLDFIMYLNSDEGLRLFTEKAGAPRGYSYDVPESSLANLSPFSKSLVKYTMDADVIYKYTGDSFYNNNLATFHNEKVYGAGNYRSPIAAFKESAKEGTLNENTKSYFKAYYDSFKNGNGNLWKNAK